MIVAPTGPMMLPDTVVKITKGGYRNDNQTAYARNDCVPRPTFIRLQENIPEQQLQGLRTEQLLCRLPSELPMFCRQKQIKSLVGTTAPPMIYLFLIMSILLNKYQ